MSYWPVYCSNGPNWLIIRMCGCCSWASQGQSKLKQWLLIITAPRRGSTFIWEVFGVFLSCFFPHSCLSSCPFSCLTDRESLVAVKGQLVVAHNWCSDSVKEKEVSKTEGEEKAVIFTFLSLRWLRLTSCCQPGQRHTLRNIKWTRQSSSCPSVTPSLSPFCCSLVYLVENQI